MLVLLALVLILPTPTQSGYSDPRGRALYELIQQLERPVTSEALASVEAGLTTDAPAVRVAAVEVLHAFAFIGHGKKRAANPESWDAERREVLARFRPRLIEMLGDPAANVRHHVIMALGTLDATIDQGKLRGSPDTMNRFAAMFSVETLPQARAEIVKFFALAEDMRPDVPTERVLLAALDDSDDAVVQFGATGIGNAGYAQHLPRLVPLLRHSSPGVAQAAANAFNTMHAHARPYLADLQRAADNAPDGPFKSTLLAAIRLAQSK